MKKIIVCIFCFILTGCQSIGQAKLIHKTGSSSTERIIAYDQCKIASFREIPQNLATQTEGGYYNPGTVQCTNIGGFVNCNTIGQVNIPATTITYDVNTKLRNRYIERCLSAKSFSIIELPLCKTTAEKAAYLARRDNQPQPPANEISCAAGEAIY